MKNLNVTENAKQAIYNFALEYSYRKNVVDATVFGSDYCDIVKDVDDYEKLIALFLANKLEIPVEKMNDDCTFTTEIVKVA
jgi:hypothetical protein